MTLTPAEAAELDALAFRVVADLPMSIEDVDRYRAIKAKRDGPPDYVAAAQTVGHDLLGTCQSLQGCLERHEMEGYGILPRARFDRVGM